MRIFPWRRRPLVKLPAGEQLEKVFKHRDVFILATTRGLRLAEASSTGPGLTYGPILNHLGCPS